MLAQHASRVSHANDKDVTHILAQDTAQEAVLVGYSVHLVTEGEHRRSRRLQFPHPTPRRCHSRSVVRSSLRPCIYGCGCISPALCSTFQKA